MDSDKEDRKDRKSTFRYFVSGLAGAVLGISVLAALGPSNLFSSPQQNMPRLTSPQQVPSEITRINNSENPDVISAAEKVIPSVVGITAYRAARGGEGASVGSGIIVDSAGYVLTNNHVAGDGVNRIIVSLYDGREVNGTTIWTDPALDLAIVRLDADGLRAAVLGDSKAVRIGQQAIAIGNPLGLTFQRTVTAGIISAVNRTIQIDRGVFMEDLIQTDASINPGNSGGPLINVNGEVVGINTIKVTAAEALGFAVPVNVIKPVVDRLRSDGRYDTPDLALQALDREMGKVYDFVLDRGVYVYDCKDGGCAHKAGIRKGDAILSVDGTDIETPIDLKEALYRAGMGKNVRLRVRTPEGDEKDIYVKLDGVK